MANTGGRTRYQKLESLWMDKWKFFVSENETRNKKAATRMVQEAAFLLSNQLTQKAMSCFFL